MAHRVHMTIYSHIGHYTPPSRVWWDFFSLIDPINTISEILNFLSFKGLLTFLINHSSSPVLLPTPWESAPFENYPKSLLHPIDTKGAVYSLGSACT
jgi:hypothetical protein